MSLVCYTNRGALAPWNPLRDLEKEVNGFLGLTPRTYDWLPAVDFRESEETYTLDAEVPGLDKENIQIEVEDNVITLKGERKNEHEEQKEGYYRVERSYGRFERSFEVPGGFDGGKVEAKLENGVLHITLPKREEAKPKHITVNVK